MVLVVSGGSVSLPTCDSLWCWLYQGEVSVCLHVIVCGVGCIRGSVSLPTCDSLWHWLSQGSLSLPTCDSLWRWLSQGKCQFAYM